MCIRDRDGREWIRVVDGDSPAAGGWKAVNDGQGAWLYQNGGNCSGMVIEITGYFNDINTLNYTYSNNPNDIDIKVNGTMSHEGHATCSGVATQETPLAARYNRPGSLSNFGSTVSASLGTSPAINTIHIQCTNGASEYWRNYGIELIAHDKFTDATCDTTNSDATVTMDSTAKLSVGLSVTGTGIAAGSTVASITNATTFELSANATATNANQTLTFGAADIFIPAQNVVSFGKKILLKRMLS